MPNLPRLPKRKRKRSNRNSPTSTAYNSKWEKASRIYRLNNPICPVCEALGEATDITPGQRKGSTDHVIRISKGGSMYDYQNLMGLCNYHHDLKSWMESAGKIDWLIGERNDYGYLVPTKAERQQVIDMLVNKHTED